MAELSEMYLLSLPGEVGGSEAVLVEIDGDLLLLDLPHHVRGRLVTQCILYKGGTGGPKKGDLCFFFMINIQQLSLKHNPPNLRTACRCGVIKVSSHRSEEIAVLPAVVEDQGHSLILGVAVGQPRLVPAGEDSQELEAVACSPDREEVASIVCLPGPAVQELAHSSVAPGTGEGSRTAGQ